MAKKQPKVAAGSLTGKTLKTDWETPERYLDPARTYWGGAIPFDAATAPDNPTRALSFCAVEEVKVRELTLFGWEETGTRLSCDGLTIDWPESTWLNPPYGQQLRPWLEKAAREASENRREVISLLTATRFENKWFRDYLKTSNAICFVDKRIPFRNPATGDEVSGSAFASMYVGHNVEPARFAWAFEPVGDVVETNWRPRVTSEAWGSGHDRGYWDASNYAADKLRELADEMDEPGRKR